MIVEGPRSPTTYLGRQFEVAMSDIGEHTRLLGGSEAASTAVAALDDNRVETPGETSNGSNDGKAPRAVTKTARRLYVSHFLSTWNSRVFEFGSVLYLATIFPGTLLPMSVYAVARAASAILLSSLVGQYIDTGDRLRVVRHSIGMY